MAGSRAKIRPPSTVLERYSELKRKYDFPISLKRIGAHYYIYKQLIAWDKEQKKYVCKEMKYLGSISNEGAFKPKRMSASDVASATAIIAAYGGKVTMPESPKAIEAPSSISETDRMVLTELTMNSRMQISELSRRLAIDEKKLGYRLRTLEKRLGIIYRPNITLFNAGYLWFIVFARFTDLQPDSDQLKKEIELIPSVQFGALSTGGKYDLMLLVSTINEDSLPGVLKNIRLSPSVKDIKSEWYVSYLHLTKGFVPIRQQFMEQILKASVWTNRSQRSATSISKNEYSTLLSLNNDGAVSFRDIEQKNGMAEGSAKYSFERLVERKIIDRVTLCMTGVRVLYNAVIIMEIVEEGAYAATKQELFRFIIKEGENHLVNKLSLVADMGAPYGAIFMVPILRDGDLERIQADMASKVKGIKISTMLLTKTLCGIMPYNRFDNTKSTQYARMESDKMQKKV